MKQLLIFFIIAHLFVPVSSQTFHVILVTNTLAYDIGKSCEIDQMAMTIQLNEISAAIGYKLNLIPVSNTTFSYETLAATIQNLTCDTSDIVFLYYSGHGFNDTTRLSKWPLMHLNSGTYPLDLAHDNLKKKGARLVITLADCCNIIAEPLVFRAKAFIPVEANDSVAKVAIYKSLFLGTKGSVIASGAEISQCAYGTTKDGGYFTKEFIVSIKTAINYASTVTWEILLKETKNKVVLLCADKKQVPQYVVNTMNHIPTGSQFPSINKPTNNLLSYDIINQYFNDIANTTTNETKCKELVSRSSEYFLPKARVDIYVNTTLTEVNTIEDFLTRIRLHGSKIATINLIESKSEIDIKTQKYGKITVQEIWKTQ